MGEAEAACLGLLLAAVLVLALDPGAPVGGAEAAYLGLLLAAVLVLALPIPLLLSSPSPSSTSATTGLGKHEVVISALVLLPLLLILILVVVVALVWARPLGHRPAAPRVLLPWHLSAAARRPFDLLGRKTLPGHSV